jgi:putative toxin-antitoxin system antitoxin component (TIGR02293 family)
MATSVDLFPYAAVMRLLGFGAAKSSAKPPAVRLRSAVREGLPFSAFESVAAQIGIPPPQLTALLGIPNRTLARRKSVRQLGPQESDRLFRLARSFAQVVAVLGSLEKARVWLRTPNRALGGDIPLELLDTEIGSRQVEEVLFRLEHGIFS